MAKNKPRAEQVKLQLMCPDGKVHPVRKIGNIYQVLKKGKMVTGTVEGDSFIPYPEGKNAKVFDPTYRTGKGWMVSAPEFVGSPTEKPEVQEVLTLWDVANAGGELVFDPGKVEVIAKALHLLADLSTVDFNPNRVRKNLTNLGKSGWGDVELKLIQVKPEVHMVFTSDFQSNVIKLLELFNKK